MAFGWAGGAAGASDALTEILTRKRLEAIQQQQIAMQQAEQAQQNSQFDASMGLRTREFEADEADRTAQRTRQAEQDEIAAGARRQDQNAVGVRRMIWDFLVQRGSQPLDAGSRQTLQGMALGEGVDLPESVTADPSAGLADYEAKRKIDLKYRPPTQGAQQSPEWVKTSTGQVVKRIPQAGDQPYDAVAARQAEGGNDVTSPYSDERRTRVRDTITEILGQKQPDDTYAGGMLSGATTGLGGSIAQRIPGTDARYLRGKLSTLKSGIAFGELTEMREASKTGGALGQVAVRELELLENALGAIDQGLKDEHLAQELEKITGSLDRWERAKTQGRGGGGRGSVAGPGPGAGGGGGGRVYYDANGDPVTR